MDPKMDPKSAALLLPELAGYTEHVIAEVKKHVSGCNKCKSMKPGKAGVSLATERLAAHSFMALYQNFMAASVIPDSLIERMVGLRADQKPVLIGLAATTGRVLVDFLTKTAVHRHDAADTLPGLTEFLERVKRDAAGVTAAARTVH